MSLAILSGFAALHAGVVDYFEANGITANVVVGWRERDKQMNQGPGRANRVVIIPGSLNGRGGRITQPHTVGRRSIGPKDAPVGWVRPLRDWGREITLSIWAYDGTKRTDELAQVVAAETLLEQTMRAVHSFAFADAIWGDVQWTPQAERSFGQELLVGLTFRHPLFDIPVETVAPPIAADVRKEPPPAVEEDA
jgi:hypothetical protein